MKHPVLAAVLSMLLGTMVAATCDQILPLATSEAEQLQTVATRALQLELDIENLRPMAQVVKGSFPEERLDELHGRLAQVAEWLAVAGETDDYVMLGPASATVHFVGLAYDLVRTDLQASARGFGGTVHRATSEGFVTGHAAMERIQADPGWVARSPEEVAEALTTMVRCRHAVSAAPVTNVLRTGVIVASVYSGTYSFARSGPVALGRLAEWLRGTGRPAAALVATTGTDGVTIQAVAGSAAGAGVITSTITVTVAEVQALASAGILSTTAHMLFAMARGSYHHILTDKNYVSSKTGGPWSPRFEDFLQKAGLKFSHPANRVWLKGHRGPHPAAYHDEVFRRLASATKGLRAGTPQYREAVLRTLKELGQELQTKGSRLNLLLAGGG